jgi:threonine/homoserine/homoserine lactone efflux protein
MCYVLAALHVMKGKSMAEISPYISGILLAYTAFLLGIASPGPNVLVVIGTSMSVGRGSAMALALGAFFAVAGVRLLAARL